MVETPQMAANHTTHRKHVTPGPVTLLRNLDPANGISNGTRLVVRGCQRNSIDAEIVLGQHAGKRVFLPQIPLCPSDDEMFPFQFKRKQFPIRLSFAMPVNKSQG
jgi:ATP-dependent DNA helicase PIF1